VPLRCWENDNVPSLHLAVAADEAVTGLWTVSPVPVPDVELCGATTLTGAGAVLL
jgi:hypothetical protein